MSWFLLVVAGLLEVGWAVCLKQSDGLSRPLPAVAAVILMIASVALLALSLKELPLGTAYAAWTGIGAVGTAVVGMLMGESRDLPRLLCVMLILAGVVGLKLFSSPAKVTTVASSTEMSDKSVRQNDYRDKKNAHRRLLRHEARRERGSSDPPILR